MNPTDSWAWAGLAGDTVDLIPFVTGVGEVTRTVKTVNKVADVTDTVKIAKIAKSSDNIAYNTKAIKNARSSAVKMAWINEFDNVLNGGRGISRTWTNDEIGELLARRKVTGYQGHHMKSVKGYPYLAHDPTNIQFLTRQEHLKAHFGNYRNITHGRYLP